MIRIRDQKMKVLVVGCGLGGRKHIDIVRKSTRSVLAGIVAPLRDNNICYAHQIGVPIFSSINEALDLISVDSGIIASPNKYHHDHALSFIDRHLPILVEKPLATNLESAQSIVLNAKTRNVPVLVGHHRSYNPLLSIAREFINSDRFGKIVAMQGSALFRKPEYYFDDASWRRRIGGGPILINLIHDIGVMRHLCGEISSVFAFSSNKARGFEVEDTASISIRFENGALGSFLISDVAASNRSWELTTGENPSYPRLHGGTCYHIVGTNGSIDFPTLDTRYYDLQQSASWWKPFICESLSCPVVDPLEVQYAHFEDVVINDATPKVSAVSALENMLIANCIQESIALDTPIQIDMKRANI